jgi:outer membrane protein assembly factor BamA
MHHRYRTALTRTVASLLFVIVPTHSQDTSIPRATLREIRSDGLKTLAQPHLVALTGLAPGGMVGREDLQVAADKLVQTGLFANVKYNFQTRVDGVLVTFHVEEAPRMPAYFDNLPWFADGELNDALRKGLPFYDGTLPGAGGVVDQASAILHDFLAAHGLEAAIDHQVLASPYDDGTIQQFHIDRASLQIAQIDFSDPALNSSKTIQQYLSDLKGKPYSRMAIDLFLTEHVRPIYLQQGFLRAKLGPPEVRLTGNPNQKLPDQIPVFIPITPGPAYHWKGVEWKGNTLLPSANLTTALGLKSGDVADGMALQGAWERVGDEYARRGYLETKIDPAAVYDDKAHTIFYIVRIDEGKPFRYANMVITGLSPAAEKRLREAWPIRTAELFDKIKYEEFLTKLQSHPDQVFGDLPLHYDTVGHWLQTDAAKGTADVLLDFK